MENMDTSERLTGAAAVACVPCRKLKVCLFLCDAPHSRLTIYPWLTVLARCDALVLLTHLVLVA